MKSNSSAQSSPSLSQPNKERHLDIVSNLYKPRNYRNVDWDKFADDKQILSYLGTLPRYKNSFLKSAWYRFLFFASLLICRTLKRDKPLFVVLVTNNNCNLNCTYCYGEYGTKTAEKNYSTKKLIQMIDELKNLGSRLLTMHGGEALLRKDFGEVLNYAKLRGFYISVNTNGYLVPKKLEELKCADTIVLSLDGSKENNDKYRGKGCYEKVIAAMDALSAISMPTVISATLTDDTLEDMDFLANLAVQRNMRVQYSILYNDQYLEKKTGKRLSSDSVIRKTTQRIKELRHMGYPVYYCDSVLDATINWPETYEQKREYSLDDLAAMNPEQRSNPDFIPCYHGRLKFQIDADGRVIRCWAKNKPDAPNIHDLGLKAALKSVNRDNYCQHCTYLANNEHNALLDLDAKSIVHIARIQLGDALKFLIRKGGKSKPPPPSQSGGSSGSELEPKNDSNYNDNSQGRAAQPKVEKPQGCTR